MSDAPNVVAAFDAFKSLWPHIISDVEAALAAGRIKELGKMSGIMDALKSMRDAIKFLDSLPELKAPTPVMVPEPIAKEAPKLEVVKG